MDTFFWDILNLKCTLCNLHIKSKITAHTHSPIYENVGMGWMAFWTLHPTTDTGRWEEEDQEGELASLSLASFWQRKGRRRGRGTFQLGSTRACKRKSTQLQKKSSDVQRKGKGPGGDGWLFLEGSGPPRHLRCLRAPDSDWLRASNNPSSNSWEPVVHNFFI